MCDNSGKKTVVEYSMICLLLFPTLLVMLC
jgi:hypothetical protein